MAYGTYTEQAKAARSRISCTRQALDQLDAGQVVIKDVSVNYDSIEVNPASFISFSVREAIGIGAPSSISLATYNALSEANQNAVFRADDTDFPIGSSYTGLTVSGGAITAAKKWLKTAANTWTVIGSVT